MNPNNKHKKDDAPSKNPKLFDKKIREKHREELGYSLPKDYFKNSKIEILESINSGKRGRLILFSKRNVGWTMVAAGLALLVTLNVFRTGGVTGIEEIETILSDSLNQQKNSHLAMEEEASAEDDILVSSLFVEDDDIDDFIDSYVLDEMVQEEISSN